MKVAYDPDFYKQIKKLTARIRKSLREKILIFSNFEDIGTHEELYAKKPN